MKKIVVVMVLVLSLTSCERMREGAKNVNFSHAKCEERFINDRAHCIVCVKGHGVSVDCDFKKE